MSEGMPILIVEDLPTDAELCEREVNKVLPESRFLRVETREAFLAALADFRPALIISDYKMPRFDGMAALQLALELAPETPFIVLTGSMNEETAVACMKAGAWDYVIKEHIRRLAPAVLSALKQKSIRRERRKAEEQTLRQGRLLAAINSIFHETLLAESRETTVADACLTVAQELTGSEFGYVGEITPEGLYTVTALSHAASESCRIPEAQAGALMKEMVSVRGIWGRVIRTEQTLLENDPARCPDRVGTPEGHPPLTSLLGVPLKDQGRMIGMIALANRAAGYTEANRQDMEALSVAFVQAIRRKQAETKLNQTLESLRKAFGTIIRVMVAAVETRDPYTAGHQTRVADIARAIAAEMGLPPSDIDGVRMTGAIHDIGKLSIPAEILSKPTKLSEIEFALIKEHPRKGFEMLQEVESPWPLAQVVYQHHERMDGSGYPRRLQGEEILPGARILAVADVVEAMASHRPYRAGLGIDAALNEIEQNRGISYDIPVADACLRLFREKGFQLTRG